MFDKLQKHVKSQSVSDASAHKWRFFAAPAIKTDPETLPRAPEARAEKVWRFGSQEVGKLANFALKHSLFWDFPVKCQIHYFQIFLCSINSLFSDFPKSAKFVIKFISAPPSPLKWTAQKMCENSGRRFRFSQIKENIKINEKAQQSMILEGCGFIRAPLPRI